MHDLEFLERNPNNNPSFYEVTDNIRATIHYENCWITWFFTFTAWAVMFLQTEALSEQKVYECCLQKKKKKKPVQVQEQPLISPQILQSQVKRKMNCFLKIPELALCQIVCIVIWDNTMRLRFISITAEKLLLHLVWNMEGTKIVEFKAWKAIRLSCTTYDKSIVWSGIVFWNRKELQFKNFPYDQA